MSTFLLYIIFCVLFVLLSIGIGILVPRLMLPIINPVVVETITAPVDKTKTLPMPARYDHIRVYYDNRHIVFSLSDFEENIIEGLSSIYPEIKPGISYLIYNDSDCSYHLHLS